MKRIGNLWKKITSIENIKLAHQKARKGKLHYLEVQEFDLNPDKYCRKIQELLVSKTFTTSPYQISDIFDGRKKRTVYKLPYFPDRVVHHALMNVIGPIIQKSLIRDTFQSLPSRGTSDAAKRVKGLVKEKKPKYALKLDVEKYYPSVDNTILKAKLSTKFKCKDTLWLLENIIDSNQGLPIGNYTSQILGNFYLSNLDWKIKQSLKPYGYFRYCDDLVLMGSTKSYLKYCLSDIETTLKELNLRIKPNWQIVDLMKQGVDFVGFVFKHGSTRLRKSIKQNFVSSCSDSCVKLNTLMAYKGWIKHSNSKQLWRRHTGKFSSQYRTQLKRKI